MKYNDKSDTLTKVLVKENLIKDMEDEIKYLEDEIKDFDLKNHLNLIKKIKRGTFITFSVFALLFWEVVAVISAITSGEIIFEMLLSGFVVGVYSTPLMMVVGALLAREWTLKYKEEIKEYKGNKAQLEYLKKTIIKEKEKVKELKKDLTNNKGSIELECVKVKEKEELKKLRRWLESIYKLGYKEKKYYNYYKDGELDKKLGEYYTKEELKYFKKYFEEKGPVLSKKKNK